MKKKRACLICRAALTLLISCVAWADESPAAGSAAGAELSLQWAYFLDLFKDQEKLMQYSTVQASPDRISQYLMMTLAQGYILLSQADPDYPEFLLLINHVINIGGPNPDTTYYYVALDGNNSYRIFGDRGTVSMIEFQAGYDFLGFADPPGRNLSSSTISDYQIKPDGSFEILLGKEKPKGYEGNWMFLDERTNYMLVRQVGYTQDEVNARMAIEKLGGTPGHHKTGDNDRLMRSLADYVRNGSRALLGLNESLKRNSVYNKFVIPDWSKLGGVIGQTYHHTLYKAGKGEALIVTVKVPEACKYWNIQSNDLLLQVNDYLRYQSSLNGYLDRSDGDGLTRIVLSHRDPGVANWVDLNNLEEGYLIMRWIGCGEIPNPVIEQVPFADIASHLPRDTKWVTPEGRRQALREMSASRQLRRYW